MSELGEILKTHFARNQAMEPQDAVKLIYQNEFGASHLVSDEEQSLARLEDEYRLLDQKPGPPFFEDIGNGLCRVMLQALDETKVPLTVLNRLFVLGAGQVRGTAEGFAGKLHLLRNLAEKGDAPFSKEELDRYLEAYARSGYPPASHGCKYKKLYRPSYRVVPCRFTRFWPLFQAICSLLEEKKAALVAIDGMAASGKTTLSALLTEVFSCSVVHMDDFFLPGALRTPERFRQPGGNVHYERFAAQVSPFLKSGESFSYAPFDCRRMDYALPVAVPPRRLTVVEGVYSLHPELHAPYDLRVFLRLDGEEQKRRVLVRNGPELEKRFMEEWVPMENAYFEAFEFHSPVS
jgi:uridine kinase